MSTIILFQSFKLTKFCFIKKRFEIFFKLYLQNPLKQKNVLVHSNSKEHFESMDCPFKVYKNSL